MERLLCGDQAPDYLTEIPFHLEFDPYYTAQGKIIPVDTAFTLDGQRFILTEVELYPTHLRVNMRAEADNTASLTGLDLYLENEYRAPAVSPPPAAPRARRGPPSGWTVPFSTMDSI